MTGLSVAAGLALLTIVASFVYTGAMFVVAFFTEAMKTPDPRPLPTPTPEPREITRYDMAAEWIRPDILSDIERGLPSSGHTQHVWRTEVCEVANFAGYARTDTWQVCDVCGELRNYTSQERTAA